MISVGIDVSKGKSMVCILKPNEDYVCKPFELLHCKEDLELLDELLQKLDGEVKVVMEATGIYNLPILTFLVEKGYFVSVINPCVMKKYARNNNFRNVKTEITDPKVNTPVKRAFYGGFCLFFYIDRRVDLLISRFFNL